MSILLAIDMSLEGAPDDACPTLGDHLPEKRQGAAGNRCAAWGMKLEGGEVNIAGRAVYRGAQAHPAASLVAVGAIHLADNRRHGVFDLNARRQRRRRRLLGIR
jgi:hypothetical protein